MPKHTNDYRRHCLNQSTISSIWEARSHQIGKEVTL